MTIDGETFTAEVTCRACPLQIEGAYRGRPYYFRLRGGAWSLSLDGPEGDILAEGVVSDDEQGEADVDETTRLIACLLDFHGSSRSTSRHS